jgi:hypothetical protein
MKNLKKAQFAVCVDNEGYKASLEVGKLYQVIPYREAKAHGLIRIVDESGGDYAFSASRFHSMNVPPAVQKALLSPRA